MKKQRSNILVGKPRIGKHAGLIRFLKTHSKPQNNITCQILTALVPLLKPTHKSKNLKFMLFIPKHVPKGKEQAYVRAWFRKLES